MVTLLLFSLLSNIEYINSDAIILNKNSSQPTFQDFNKSSNSSFKNKAGKNYQALSNYFIENQGQLANDFVKYYYNQPNMGIGFTNSGIIFRLVKSLEKEMGPLLSNAENTDDNKIIYQFDYIKLEFAGSNIVTPLGLDKLQNSINYFSSSQKKTGATEAQAYSQIIYSNIYDGIDLIYYFSNGECKYDFIVNPNGDPSVIKLHYTGIENLSINKNGSILIKTEFGSLKDKNLFIYQETNSNKEGVQGSFQLINETTYSFNIEQYDKSIPLVIDPTYSTRIYGNGYTDEVFSIAVDNEKNAYITGRTTSTDFPTNITSFNQINSGSTDIFVAKLNPEGNALVYSTYIGGNGNDWAFSIVLDNFNNALVTGFSTSNNFPVTPNALFPSLSGGSDVFLIKLSSNGSSLLYSTYIGGSEYEEARSIVLDGNGNIILAGRSSSSNFPTTLGAYQGANSGSYDAFVLKLNSIGSTLLFSTLIGGGGMEHIYSLKLDNLDNIYITGYTSSNNYPTTPNAYDTSYNGIEDIFVSKLDSNGSVLLLSTFLGGSDSEQGTALCIDGGSNVFITGRVGSTDFPTTEGAYQVSHKSGWLDVAVVKLSSDFQTLIYSTFIGGTYDDQPQSMLLDQSELPIILGCTPSRDFPTTDGAFRENPYNFDDIFLFKLNENGSKLLYSTYLGGWGDDYAFSMVKDQSNHIYITGTSTSDFSTSLGSQMGDTHDIFIMKVEIFVDDANQIIVDNINPILESPEDRLHEMGQNDHFIIWTAFDENPANYRITWNGSEVVYDSWESGVPIKIDLENYPLGVNIFTVEVADKSGNTVKDTVTIRIIDQQLSSSTTNLNSSSSSKNAPTVGLQLSIYPIFLGLLVLIGITRHVNLNLTVWKTG
ncbi:MAG: DUF7948 domain-containing protein [Candidatus Kariarchaeaceae archaeon]|jgi:hypothetical protein